MQHAPGMILYGITALPHAIWLACHARASVLMTCESPVARDSLRRQRGSDSEERIGKVDEALVASVACVSTCALTGLTVD